MVFRRTIHLLAAACCLVIGPCDSFGTSIVPPSDKTILSLNQRYELKISAKSGLHRLRKANGLHKTLWTFRRHVWHDDYFVSSTGGHVACISWEFVKSEDLDLPTVVIYGAKGEVSRMTFRQVGDARRYRRREIGPIGEFRRVWSESVAQTGETVEIKTPSGRKLVVDLANGSITVRG